MLMPLMNNWIMKTAPITAIMPTSGCFFRIATIATNRTRAIKMPLKRGLRRCSASSQAVVSAKQGFRNSLGWMRLPRMEIQRCAPLVSTPITMVSAVAVSAPANPNRASRRTSRGGNMDTPMMMPSDRARNTSCFRMNNSRDALIRSATAGLAARTMM